jgi:mannose-6-phosphate isomerase-like protein (cupin superfamily)
MFLCFRIFSVSNFDSFRLGESIMRHIRAKQYENPPAYVTAKISPIDPLPEESLVSDYGVDTLSEGASSDLHYHDCDEWWIIVSGRALVTGSFDSVEAGPGDMIFTPMGETHRIEALSLVTVAWFGGTLRGEKRKGHLHLDTEEIEKLY